MTNVEAQQITAYIGELEFPKLYETALQFALFQVSAERQPYSSCADNQQTYGIPTISDLLVATKEFSTPANASKRYADTGILIAEYVSFSFIAVTWKSSTNCNVQVLWP
jgi:hypothetical protein